MAIKYTVYNNYKTPNNSFFCSFVFFNLHLGMWHLVREKNNYKEI